MKEKGGEHMSKYVARVYVPLYPDIEADNPEEAEMVAENWYKEQKKDWTIPTVEILPMPSDDEA
jgi:hypothetical protein